MVLSGRTWRSWRLWGVLGVSLVCLAAAVLAGTHGSRPAHADSAGLPHTAVEVSPSRCGRGWTAPGPGIQVFDLHNTSGASAEVFLENPGNQAVYGEVEGIGPGTTRELTVRLGTGTYAFKCVPDDADAVTGPTVRIAGGSGGPAAAPVTEHDLIPPALAYQKWIGGGLAEVVRLTTKLRNAIDRGDLAAARTAWLPAHLEYERMGAAYDAFGDADGQINGTDAGLPDGVRDRHFTGFHRVEYGLWHGASADALRGPAAALVNAVTALRDAWAQTRMDPAQLGLRAHEILENTVQFELTGRTDYGPEQYAANGGKADQSTPGALNLISGQTHGVVSTDPASGTEHPRQTSAPDAYTVKSPDAKGVGTVINDPDPAYDDCSGKDHTSSNALAAMQGKNIGDLLNTRRVTWGWFQGGFRPSTAWDGRQSGYAKCDTTHTNVGGASVVDYSPHHNPFSYYRSTANPHHLPPKNVDEVGHDGQANHNYDLTDFTAVAKAGKLPAVSFVKAGEYQDGHAAYSDPIDEQHFLVSEINAIQSSPQWKSTAIVVAYDDSDGWYDHAYVAPRNGSKDTSLGSDNKATDGPACQSGPKASGGYADRCGPGTRQPLLVISPYSKVNKVDHTMTDQASVLRFIEDNWRTGRVGDHSFDATAGSLRGMFDFRHPNDKQVLLNADGSVRSVGPIHRVAPVATGITPGPAMQNTAATPGADRFPAVPVGIGVGALLAAGATGTYLTLRRRQHITT
ncbi:alkaline phosphatase family protein [Streptomyces shenzhenensis]|uniref:alkaline phosphatase family protein n=1 Tax=Streptomyces shenzhenensis TaxID=943815 RepID=UPI0038170679